MLGVDNAAHKKVASNQSKRSISTKHTWESWIRVQMAPQRALTRRVLTNCGELRGCVAKK
jgi:hypothetical protein